MFKSGMKRKSTLPRRESRGSHGLGVSRFPGLVIKLRAVGSGQGFKALSRLSSDALDSATEADGCVASSSEHSSCYSVDASLRRVDACKQPGIRSTGTIFAHAFVVHARLSPRWQQQPAAKTRLDSSARVHQGAKTRDGAARGPCLITCVSPNLQGGPVGFLHVGLMQ